MEGSTLFLSNIYPHTTMPCAECAKAIVQAGIKRVVCELPHIRTDQWEDHFKVTSEIFNESGVDVVLRHSVHSEENFMEGYSDAVKGVDSSALSLLHEDPNDYELGYEIGSERARLVMDDVDG